MDRRKVILLINILFTVFLLTCHQFVYASDKDTEASFQRLNKVLKMIQSYYIDEKDTEELIDGAIDGMVKSLGDPHTAYLKPRSYEELKMETEGEYSGLGVVIGITENRLTVISPIEDTPAEKAGIEAGDQIIKIEGTNAIGISLNDAVKKLRGKADTKVTITIERANEDEPFDITLTRAKIKLKTIKIDKIEDKIGFLRITSFNKNTITELSAALLELKKMQIDSLIIDLRNNPGGLLDVVLKVADTFLEKKKIVYTRGKVEFQNKDYFASDKMECPKEWPIIVLVNKGSASASEIFAGAIKDNRRGIIVGEKTFGKGSVQTVQDLGNNYGIRLTTARYYTPNGTMIDKKGLEPDIKVKQRRFTKSESDMLKKLKKGNYINKFVEKNPGEYSDTDFKFLKNEIQQDKIYLDDALIKNTIKMENLKGQKKPLFNLELDNQLKTAIDIIKANRIVKQYGKKD